VFEGNKTIDEKSAAFSTAQQQLMRELIDAASDRLVEIAGEFAPGESDFQSAISEEGGPEGDHALIALEEEIAEYLRPRPRVIDALRTSIEFDNERDDDLYKGAMALVNESIAFAEAKWEAVQSAPNAAR
jgi:hypothetical protein